MAIHNACENAVMNAVRSAVQLEAAGGGGGGDFSPLDITNRYGLWIPSTETRSEFTLSGTIITSMTSWGGSGKSLTNGSPSFKYDSGNQSMLLSGTFGSGGVGNVVSASSVGSFSVAMCVIGTVSQYIFRAASGNVAVFVESAFDFMSGFNKAKIDLRQASGTSYTMPDGVSVSDKAYLGLSYNSSTGALKHYVGDTLQHSQTIPTGLTFTFARIGDAGSFSTAYLPALFCWEKELSESEMVNTLGWLAEVYPPL